MRQLLFLLLVILLSSFCFGATISGDIYSIDLELVDNAVVEVNSVPVQRMVAKNGSYSFNLEPGDYTITAKMISEEEFMTKENITIVSNDGYYTLDLFLFYELTDYVEDVDITVDKDFNYTSQIVVGIVLLVIALFILVIFYYSNKRERKKYVAVETKKESLDDKIKSDLIHLLKINGNMMTQKNIRKNFDYSESKISLIIKDLEKEGKLHKEKRGTVNYIKLN